MLVQLDDYRDVGSLAETYYRMLVQNALATMAREEFEEFKRLFDSICDNNQAHSTET
jgi:hypothetical protein